MSQTTWIPTLRYGAALATLATLMTAGVPLLAQQATRPLAAATQTPSAQAPAPSGGTLELSMDQAVAMALETNLGLKSDRLNLSMAAQGVVAAQSAFKPFLSSGLTRSTSKSVTDNPFQASSSTVSGGSFQTNATWRQALPWYGGGYAVSWLGKRSTTTGFSNFNPNLGSTLTVSFNQPLLQRFMIDSNRVGLETAERTRTIADLQLQQQVLQTQDQVRQAYLNLIAAINGLDVARQNKDVAQGALLNAQARINVGQAAEIDKIQTEASVLTSDEQVIISEARVSSAEDQLRALIVDVARPDYWQLQIKPTDTISITPQNIDVDAAIKNALANRLDLVIARRSIEITRLNVRLNQNLVKPSLDFAASYSASGTGGTAIDTTTGTTLTAVTGFGSVLGDVFGGTNPSWTFGVTAGYPIGRSAAQASLARAQIQESQQQIDLRNQELAVTAAVRDAARLVVSGYKRVESTQKALDANVRQLEAEQRKLSVGMSTTFDVLQKQTLLAAARLADLNARIAYNQALISFDRVQKIR